MGLKIYRVPKNLEIPKTNNGVVKCKMKVLNIILKILVHHLPNN